MASQALSLIERAGDKSCSPNIYPYHLLKLSIAEGPLTVQFVACPQVTFCCLVTLLTLKRDEFKRLKLSGVAMKRGGRLEYCWYEREAES